MKNLQPNFQKGPQVNFFRGVLQFLPKKNKKKKIKLKSEIFNKKIQTEKFY